MRESVDARNIIWDYVRGIAMVMIVLHHLYPRFYEIPYINGTSIIPSICYTCQIPIFMFVSGMFANKSTKKYEFVTFIRNKAIRLLIPFASFIFIWAMIRPANVVNVIFSNFKDGYWYTFVLFEMIAIVAIIDIISKRYRKSKFYLLILFYGMLTIFKMAFPVENTINSLFSINLLWHYYPFFFLGIYYTMLYNYDWFTYKYVIIYLLMYIVTFAFFYYKDFHIILPLCNFFGLFFFVSITLNGFLPLKRFFSMVGFYSMQIYLLHFFAKLLVVYILPVDNPIHDFVLNMILALVVISVSIYISRLLMKSSFLALVLFGTRNLNGKDKP